MSDIEIIPLDNSIREIIEMNKSIVEINMQIVIALCSPKLIYQPDNKQEDSCE